MSDTPRTDAMQGHRMIAHVPVHFAQELERELAQRTAERDQLAARVAELEAKAEPLAEMWRELESYQPIANANGHGESWRKMCERRTQSAAWAAASCAKRYSLSARNAAEFVAIGLGESRAQQAIKAIRKAKEEDR